jgi:hypothetical protein
MNKKENQIFPTLSLTTEDATTIVPKANLWAICLVYLLKYHLSRFRTSSFLPRTRDDAINIVPAASRRTSLILRRGSVKLRMSIQHPLARDAIIIFPTVSSHLLPARDAIMFPAVGLWFSFLVVCLGRQWMRLRVGSRLPSTLAAIKVSAASLWFSFLVGRQSMRLRVESRLPQKRDVTTIVPAASRWFSYLVVCLERQSMRLRVERMVERRLPQKRDVITIVPVACLWISSLEVCLGRQSMRFRVESRLPCARIILPARNTTTMFPPV